MNNAKGIASTESEKEQIERLKAELAVASSKLRELEAKIDTPEIIDFANAVKLEAAHQRKRWGRGHDVEKTDADWYWLIGYLAGKALHNPPNDMDPDDARLHRIVTVAAAAANWHAARLEARRNMTGIDPTVLRYAEGNDADPS